MVGGARLKQALLLLNTIISMAQRELWNVL